MAECVAQVVRTEAERRPLKQVAEPKPRAVQATSRVRAGFGAGRAGGGQGFLVRRFCFCKQS